MVPVDDSSTMSSQLPLLLLKCKSKAEIQKPSKGECSAKPERKLEEEEGEEEKTAKHKPDLGEGVDRSSAMVFWSCERDWRVGM